MGEDGPSRWPVLAPRPLARAAAHHLPARLLLAVCRPPPLPPPAALRVPTAYSFSLTTFSPSGKLLQIEYALNAVAKGRLSLGIRAKNGVVIATEKKVPSVLVDEESIESISQLTSTAGLVFSGMSPDFRVMVAKGRKAGQAYFRTYQEHIPTGQLVKSLASTMQEFTHKGGCRPFGVSLLACGYDDDGPQLFQIDPSGAYYGWKATACGKNFVNAKNFLEKRYSEEMELEDAIHTALLTLRDGFEGEMNSTNIEVGVIGDDRVFRVLSQAEVKDYLEEAE